MNRSVEVSAFSDLHGNLIDIPKCELALMCGDFSPLMYQNSIPQMQEWIEGVFIRWLSEQRLKYTRFLFIAGNHDFICQWDGWKTWWHNKLLEYNLYGDIIYLENSSYFFRGISIYGCPYSDTYGWAFYSNRKWKYAPADNADIMLCHAAPDIGSLGITELTGGSKADFGCKPLKKAIDEFGKNLSYLFCGHIHGGDHNLTEYNGIKMYNVSVLDEAYQIHYKPFNNTLV